jgi:hypothetical protein
MAQQIYKFEEIETFVDCAVTFTPVESGFEFAFHNKILNLICFELFVNAKKNRWHFLDDIPIAKNSKNKLIVEIEQIHEDQINKLVIKITNIGPQVDEDILQRLNSDSRNVKHNDLSAGTSLLKYLVIKILKGKLEFTSKQVCPTTNMQEFTVTLTLNEMT